MLIKIELISDLCLQSGDTYNSLVDADVIYDAYGLPYVPAKRLKGCIREAALEMQEMGLMTEEEYVELFGKAGNQKSAFSISNGYLPKYEQMKQALDACPFPEIKQVQNVINQYTYIRHQTAVDLKTGTALKNSLRAMRVVKKGLVFTAECQWNKEVSKPGLLKQAVSLVKHIGTARTRGLGWVEMCLDEEENQETLKPLSKSVNTWLSKNKKAKEADDHRYRLRVCIDLKSPLTCKSAQGNQTVTEDYIAGSKILGLIAGAMTKEDYRDMMSGDQPPIISNAYIMHEGHRCVPAEISLQKEKDQKYDKNHQMKIYNMLFTNPSDLADRQMTPANIAYWDQSHTVMNVDSEISYHHQRPRDKSIGRATGRDGSSFYQLAAISEGQRFCGYIEATREQAIKMLTVVKSLKEIRMGYGRQNGFGAVQLMIDEVEAIKKETDLVNQAEIVLASDVILYNEMGMPSADLNVLERYLRRLTGVNDLKVSHPFLKTSVIGGFNVTWGKRKPVIYGLGKGSAFLVHSETQTFDFHLLNGSFIGERVFEGYGELIAKKVTDNGEVIVSKPARTEKVETENLWKNDLLQDLLQHELKLYVHEIIQKTFNKKRDQLKQKSGSVKAAVSKLRTLFRTEERLSAMIREVEGFEKEETRALCLKMIEWIDSKVIHEEAIKKIREKYDPEFESQWSETVCFKEIYRFYITSLNNFIKEEL